MENIHKAATQGQYDELLARAKGATLFEAGQTLHAVNAIYAGDPHLDLIVEGWQEALGHASQKPTRDIDKYSPFSPISEMSLLDINKRIVETQSRLSFPFWCIAVFDAPKCRLEISVRASNLHLVCIERVEQLDGWLRGLCFADTETTRPTLDVAVADGGPEYGWDCIKQHMNTTMIEKSENVATFPTMPGATCFCDAVKEVFDAIDSGVGRWRKEKL